MMTLLACVVLELGVKVAVQVTPPSPELTALRLPLATVKSALLKPLTASLKVIVTNEVVPAFKEVVLITKEAVGRTVSIA